MTRTAITTLAGFVTGHSPRHPRAAVERAKLAILDTAGCMLLGARSEVTHTAVRAAGGWGGGNASVYGTGLQGE